MLIADTVDLTCPAKVNLALSVGAADRSGMHPIASWIVAVQFADRLRIELTGGTASDFDIKYDPDGPVRGVVDWPLEKDLTYRAHALMQEHVGRALPVRLSLRKIIPAGSGMGGGSSNAAATLIGLNDRYGLKITTETLVSLGKHLGSDVAFHVRAMLGNPSAIVLGHGESIEPINADESINLVLIMPPYQCSTAQVYQRFDALTSNPPVVPDVAAVRALAAQSTLSPDGPFNELAEAACHVQPQLAYWRQLLHREMGLPVHVTGSGSAMFLIADDAKAARQMAQDAKARSNLPAVATRSLTTRSS